MGTQIVNTSNIPFFRVSFRKFKGLAQISHREEATQETYTKPNLMVAEKYTAPPCILTGVKVKLT